MSQKAVIQLAFLSLIIGVASVIAINIFGANAERLNRDAIHQDLRVVVSAAQTVWIAPVELQGAGQNFEANMTEGELMARLRIPGFVDTESARVVNDNAEYILQSYRPDGFTIVAVPATWPAEIRLTVERDHQNRTWRYHIGD